MSGIMMMNMSHKPAVVAGGGSSMRALLSASGQSAYDAAATDGWFNVSSSDYAAVFGGLANTNKVGMSDLILTSGGSAFVGTFGATLPGGDAQVPSGRYIIGVATRSATLGTSTFRPYTSTTFRGTYTALGATAINAPSSTSAVYFLRKLPSSATAATTYVALGPRNAGNPNWQATGSWTNAGYSANMTTWTIWNGSVPCQQWLVTTTAP